MFKLVEISTAIIFNRRLRILLVAGSIAMAATVFAFAYTLFLTRQISEFQLHAFAAISIIVGLIAPSIMSILQSRRKNQIDLLLPQILVDISEGLRAGMTFIESIEETSKRDYGWLSKELRTLVAQISWGLPNAEAFQNFSKRCGTEMTEKTIALLLAAINLGGDLRSVFASTAQFLRRMLEVKDERGDQLRPYMSIIYVTLVIFLVTMYMLYTSLAGLLTMQSTIVKVQLSREQMKILLFDLAVIEALFGGLIASKLSEGSIYTGLKHSIVMLAINTVAFIVFF